MPHSQKIRNDPHKVWICSEGTKNDGKIVTLKWCTFTAGTADVCSHLVTLMYKVNFAYKKTYTSLPHAQDSVAQGWNKGTKKDAEPNHIKIFVFRKDKRTQEDSARDHRDNLNVKNQFNPRRPQDRQLTNERVSSLINDIIQNIPSTCALYSIGHTKDDSLPELLLRKLLVSCHLKK